MKPEEYLKERLEGQIDWYDRKSRYNQKMFKWLRFGEIVVAASIPFIAGLITKESHGWQILVGFMGVLVAVVSGVLSLFQFHERWIEYRTTCESLRKEKYLFVTGTEPYKGENTFETLVQRVETLVSKENTNWAQYLMKPDKGEKHGH